MSRSSAEFDLDRIEDKIKKIQKELEENQRMAERSDKDKLWDLDKVRREYEVRARTHEEKREHMTKELKDYNTQRERLIFKIDKEKEDEEERDRQLADELYRRRMR